MVHYMNDYKYAFPLWLIALLFLSITSCNEKSDTQITFDKVKRDLKNQSITLGPGVVVEVSEYSYIKLIDVLYEDKMAIAKVFIRALDPNAKAGFEGLLSLNYEFEDDDWQIENIDSKSIKEIDKIYTLRLSELIEFPLHFSANLGDFDGVTRALKKGEPVDSPEAKKFSTALMFASERGFLDIVKFLLEEGAAPNYQNRLGFSALHAACSNNQLKVVQLLIEKGADVNIKDNASRTPLYFAVENNSMEIAKNLVSKGAKLNMKTHNNWTPLYSAVKNNSLEMAQYLLEEGAQVNLPSPKGVSSPLLIAAYNNNVDMVSLLLNAGADPDAQLSDKHPRFPHQSVAILAERQGNNQILELLREKGQKNKHKSNGPKN
jgi:ankyrin repeat protein